MNANAGSSRRNRANTAYKQNVKTRQEKNDWGFIFKLS